MSSGPERHDEIATPGPPQTREVSDGVFAYVQPDGTWWINNIGFLVGPQGVVSIDTCSTERRTRAYQGAIAAVTSAPVRTVVNTHHYGDHTFGNALFGTATIVAQERARAEVIAFGPARLALVQGRRRARAPGLIRWNSPARGRAASVSSDLASGRHGRYSGRPCS